MNVCVCVAMLTLILIVLLELVMLLKLHAILIVCICYSTDYCCGRKDSYINVQKKVKIALSLLFSKFRSLNAYLKQMHRIKNLIGK